MTGFQPSGSLHIGNYTVIKAINKIDADSKVIGVMDLHAMVGGNTNIRDVNATINTLNRFIQGDVRIYTQSDYTEQVLSLFWELMNEVSLQSILTEGHFKDKSDRYAAEGKLVTPGLLTYPILQAADILMWRANLVPVGKDQLAHIELARLLARKTNRVEPEPYLLKDYLIRDLKNPELKMSKSTPQGCLFLNDTKDVMMNKISKAVTSTNNEVTDGVTNLFNILELLEYPDLEILQINYLEHVVNNGRLKQIVKDVLEHEFF